MKLLKLRKKSGFTLVELVVYVALVSIFLVSLISFSMNVITTGEEAEINQTVMRDAQFAMSKMVEQIREASDVDVGNSIFGAHPGVLTLTTINSPANDPTVFDLAGVILQIKQGGGAAMPLLDSSLEVTNLVFTDLSRTNYTKNIKIDLTVRHKNFGQSSIANAEVVLSGSATVRVQSD